MERIVRRENKVGSMLRVNSGLRAVEELNVVRRQHGIGEGGDDAVKGRGRMLRIEKCDLVRCKLGGLSCKQAIARISCQFGRTSAPKMTMCGRKARTKPVRLVLR